MSGIKISCLYGLEPHRLGFCGPLDNKASCQLIRDYLKGKKTSQSALRKILKEFVAPYYYYSLIAKKNSIDNPFSEKVVRAYWLGNNLLKKAGGYKAHHSWHVYKTGPTTDRIKFNDGLRQLCRVSWGEVKEINKKLKVETQVIIRKGKRYVLDRPKIRQIERDRLILAQVKKSDIITFHWNQAIEVITKSQKAELENYTLKTLANL